MTKTLIITGAASGIGKASMDLFLQRSWNVIAIDKHYKDEINAFLKKAGKKMPKTIAPEKVAGFASQPYKLLTEAEGSSLFSYICTKHIKCNTKKSAYVSRQAPPARSTLAE